ncbi:MAG: hypothetical protein ACPGJS_07310 [Flammeovirgaceae bacterium]
MVARQHQSILWGVGIGSLILLCLLVFSYYSQFPKTDQSKPVNTHHYHPHSQHFSTLK